MIIFEILMVDMHIEKFSENRKAKDGFLEILHSFDGKDVGEDDM